MSSDLKYDHNNKNSIVEYAKKLIGKTLKEVCHENIVNHCYSGKGNFGQLLEKYYFQYETKFRILNWTSLLQKLN